MNRCQTNVAFTIALLLALHAVIASAQQPVVPAKPPTPSDPAVVALFEDDVPLFARQLKEVGQGGLRAEYTDCFSGSASGRVLPVQVFNPSVPEWNFRIVEKPRQTGEFRFLRLAWKKVGSGAVMIQFPNVPNNNAWNRYIAGPKGPAIVARQVSLDPPLNWTVVTCDLFGDFGAFTVRGLCLSALGEGTALFDHIYLGRTIADLDRINANPRGPARLGADQLAALREDLGSPDAGKVYRATWTLVGAAGDAVPFLEKQLAHQPSGELALVPRLLKELDDDDFDVRERATERLAKLGRSVEVQLREVLQKERSAEVRRRVGDLLAGLKGKGPAPETIRIVAGIKVLELCGSPTGRKALERLAGAGPVRSEAEAGLIRLKEYESRPR